MRVKFFNFRISSSNFFNLLLALIPFSFIAGNLIININILLLILSSLIVFKKKIIKMKYYFLDKLIFLFFFLIVLTACINDYYLYSQNVTFRGNFASIFNSFLFQKYLLLYLSVRYLIENNIINLKLFFITTTAACLFVSFDILYQLINGRDIFGYKTIVGVRKLGGPFGDELIAGGFIQRFSFFSFFVLPLFFINTSKKYLKYVAPIIFFILFIGIILSGNRMPLILFLFSIFLLFIFHKKIRKYIFLFLLFFSLIFTTMIFLNKEVSVNFKSFFNRIATISTLLVNKEYSNDKAPRYFKEFSTFYETWKMNKYFGGGVKNFRYYCHVRANIKKNSEFICNMHPHNYYLEILTETGVIGFILIITIFLIILFMSFYKKYISKTSFKENNLIVPFIFLFIAEIFPIKSTGSFFTTGNTTYLFLIMAILIGLINQNNLIEKKS